MAKVSPAAEADAPKKKGKKLILIAGVLVLTLGGGGAGAWYFMRSGDPNADAAAEPEKPAQFLPLESFTVNLLSAEGGSPQFLQAGLTLKLRHDVKADPIKERMPEIRNRILLILSGKKASDLLPVSGKQQLAAELSSSVREIMGGEGAGTKSAKAKAKAKLKAEAEAAEDEEQEVSENGAEAPDAEAEATKKKKKKARAAAAAALAKSDVEVLFTSFIIQ